jgi:hypothetical protein
MSMKGSVGGNAARKTYRTECLYSESGIAAARRWR